MESVSIERGRLGGTVVKEMLEGYSIMEEEGVEVVSGSLLADTSPLLGDTSPLLGKISPLPGEISPLLRYMLLGPLGLGTISPLLR